jgi:casein kinase II subunit beta
MDNTEYVEYEEEGSSDSEDEDESMEEVSWKQWFLTLRGNDFFCEVDDEYIEDDFNLTGLNTMVPYYDYALDVILDIDISQENLSEEQRDVIDTAAEVLYGLIHARFILTIRGQELMHVKYTNGDFGTCPRVCCGRHNVLPVGQSDIPRHASVQVYCSRCQDIFYPKSSKQVDIDGAFFGTTFCHLYLLTHPAVIPPAPSATYEPRIYGFRIHKDTSPYYQQRLMRTEEAQQESANGSNANSSNRSGRRAPPATATSADGDQIMRNGDSNSLPDGQSQPVDPNLPPTVLAGVANVHVSGNSSVVSSVQSFGVQGQNVNNQYRSK